MPEALGLLLAQTLAIEGLPWIIGISMVAGLVYGFAGFGAALVFMPVAITFIPIELAVAAFAVTAIASLVSLVPRAWRQADRRAVSQMVLVASVTVPIGLYILRTNDVITMRWAVLAVCTVTLIALISGWRYVTQPGLRTRSLVAAATGMVGGATGLVGPIMVLFQLGGQDNIERGRANTLVFLTITSFLTAPLMAMQGMLTPQAVLLGLVLIIPYGLAGLLGQALFDPARQGLYRAVAYGIIAAAILMGLPVFH